MKVASGELLLDSGLCFRDRLRSFVSLTLTVQLTTKLIQLWCIPIADGSIECADRFRATLFAAQLRRSLPSFFDGYLGVAYKFGLLVLGVLIAAILFAGWTMNRALRRPLSRLDAALIAGAAVYLLGVLITSPAQDLLFSNFSAIPLALMMGIGLRLGAQPEAATRS